jgi:hypothetical protein
VGVVSYTVSIPQCGTANVDAKSVNEAATKAVFSLIGAESNGLGPYPCTVKRHGETWTVNVDVRITTECTSYQNGEEIHAP